MAGKKKSRIVTILLIIFFGPSLLVSVIYLVSLFIPQDTTVMERALDRHDFKKAETILDRIADNDPVAYNESIYKVANAEVEYLLNEHNPISVDRLISLIQSKGSALIRTSPLTGKTDSKDVQSNNEAYGLEVTRYNAFLDSIVSRAIASNDKYLATRIVQCYKPTLEKIVSRTKLFSRDEYEYVYSYNDRDRAMARVDEAISSGQLE